MHESKDYAFIVMEIVKSGTLKAFIRYRQLKRRPLTEAEASCIVRQILDALSYIHKANIIHRDLKPQNILLRSFQQLDGAVKVADFGLGTQSSFAATEKCGTIVYMAPEQLGELSYRKVPPSLITHLQEVDVWAVGLILYILLVGKHPFYSEGDTRETYAAKLTKPVFAFPPQVSAYSSLRCG